MAEPKWDNSQIKILMGLLSEYSPKLSQTISEYRRKQMTLYYTVGAIYAAVVLTVYVTVRVADVLKLTVSDELTLVTPLTAFLIGAAYLFAVRYRLSHLQKREILRLVAALNVVYDAALTIREAMHSSGQADALVYDLRMIEAEVAIKEAHSVVSWSAGDEVRTRAYKRNTRP